MSARNGYAVIAVADEIDVADLEKLDGR